MTSKTFAGIFMIVALVVIVGVDVALAVNRHKGDTFSEILRAVGSECVFTIMVLCFAMGALAGHWWF